MRPTVWLKRPGMALAALGLMIGVLGVLSGCGTDPKAPAPKDKPAAKPADTPDEPAAKPEETPVEKLAEKPAEKPEEEPAEKPAEKPAPAPAAEDPSPTAKVSSYAPAEDLVSQVDAYLKDLGAAVASEDAYKDAEGRIDKDANTLIVVALALGMHDQDNKYKKAAPGIIKAAQELAASKDLAGAKKGVDALVAAAGAAGEGGELKWEKVAHLEPLMKAVPLISNKVKDSSLTAARIERRGADYAGYAALLAAIAQGSIPNADESEEPGEVEKWQKYCIEMRNAAGALNAAVRAKDPERALQANARLRKSCDDCHAVFHKTAEKVE